MDKKIKKFGRIGVLMGGCSTEREISLKSGKAVYESLSSQGFDVLALDVRENTDDKIKNLLRESEINLAFIALHGKIGEDGQIQSICEELRIPYTGSDSKSSRIAFNKVSTQQLLKKNGLNVAGSVIFQPKEKIDLLKVNSVLKTYPLIVKPACEGSSIGVTVVKSADGLVKAIEHGQSFGHEVLIEEFIDGRELTVGILEEKALDVVEVMTEATFFDFTAKYESGLTKYKVPADLSMEEKYLMQGAALKVHTLIGCKDLSRVDFILDRRNKPFVLEINTIPGFTKTSLLPKAALCAGINFDQLCVKLLELAYDKTKKESFSVLDH
ncbi:MAG: D-alanine--D-alanine ligase [Candidatus Omnitrophica bacterium]|nr:D-alanine--D-alanine ligase [Candidatus Omnitrophota bacterium]